VSSGVGTVSAKVLAGVLSPAIRLWMGSGLPKGGLFQIQFSTAAPAKSSKNKLIVKPFLRLVVMFLRDFYGGNKRL
jgi:hypothetical protein